MFQRKLKLNNEKTSLMQVSYSLQRRNIIFPLNLNLGQSDNNLPTRLRKLCVVFEEKLTLNYEIASVKMKAIRNLLNTASLPKITDSESKLKLLQCLVLTQLDFCNALLFVLPFTDLYGLQIVPKLL